MFALLSVSNKEGLLPLAQGLVRLGYQILSTGGTFEALSKAHVPVIAVAEHTQSPEILHGRVKTLHPKIHGGLLGRVEREDDCAEMLAHGISPIALLAVNLYPFVETVARGAPPEEIVEQIDVGGPTMIRAAAKNAQNVIVLTSPSDYSRVLCELEENQGKLSSATRAYLQRKAFEHTAAYDAAIAQWMQKRAEEDFPETLALSFERAQPLRYGENPHQRAAFYRSKTQPAGPSLAFSRVLQGKELSYNNFLDLDAALSVVLEFPQTPAAVIVKHNTPCGVALGNTLEEAFGRAKAADEVSAFGGIVALNREVDVACAQGLCSLFLEAVIAPAYSKEALALLSAKKNLRLLEAGAALEPPRMFPLAQVDYRSISGGLLAMDRDIAGGEANWEVVTRRAPTAEEMAALKFSWSVCKHVKSNAIVYANAFQTLAIGGGQTSRVDSARLAAEKGGEKLKGCAVASDAFFPFRDGVDVLARAGAGCVVQPGGSLRDSEVIAAADEHNLAMVFTGIRHFRH
ncbi:MAG: bifunctional phosphoribosylaminoimidazolecarboxamide formyltransferase/IMP cyclohydrolase [Cystobacterineae bacterium]|nr:bifunctional phosphoribosylaminoimidazolecarboxamide formyltransferase/IMP cyclohydrolase [Cystobacterineae bacterium]